VRRYSPNEWDWNTKGCGRKCRYQKSSWVIWDSKKRLRFELFERFERKVNLFPLNREQFGLRNRTSNGRSWIFWFDALNWIWSTISYIATQNDIRSLLNASELSDMSQSRDDR
jgi:hypothetical protein